MVAINVQELVESGVHFGHKSSRWHPKMAPYIFGKRNQIHIIDLRQTVRGLLRACNFLTRLAASGREVVFVGTKRQAKVLVQEEAERAGMHWVSERWLGGTLTNNGTIRERLRRLEELESLEKTGEIEQYSKKRISAFRRVRRKIHRNLSGIRNMKQLPGCLIVVDISKEYIAVKEAQKLGIPVVGLVDTDGDPSKVDICVPCNDDAFRSIQMILRQMTDSLIAGKDKAVQQKMAEEKAKELESAEAKKRESAEAKKLESAEAAAKKAAPKDAEKAATSS